jgi:hypothetical protein
MEKFIHRENLALYRKRLAEAKDNATRNVILKLLAEEEAKDGLGPNGQGNGSTGRPPNVR